MLQIDREVGVKVEKQSKALYSRSKKWYHSVVVDLGHKHLVLNLQCLTFLLCTRCARLPARSTL